MRVVGYIRETPDPNEGEPAFAQGERIRRWIADRGHQLVAVCQDTRVPGHALGRDGFKALVGIVDRGEADAVLVAQLDAFSPDKVAQEVAIHEIRRRGGKIVTTVDDELDLLEPMPEDRIRMVIRDVLEKSARFNENLGPEGDPSEGEPDETADPPESESTELGVVVELIPPDHPAENPSSAIPRR